MSHDIIELASSDPRGVGRPILFIHGFAQNRHVWRSLVDTLPAGLRPIQVDLRGHGDSGWSIGRAYSAEDYARDLPVVLDALGVERAVLVGHSLGGHVASILAAAHPDRTEALVLVDTGPSLSTGAARRIARDVDESLEHFECIEAYARRLADLHPLSDAETLGRLASSSLVRRLDGRYELKLDPGVLTPHADMAQWRNAEARFRTTLRAIACPTLLVRGGLSAVLPEQAAREISEVLLINGRLHTLDRAGHAVMLDDGPGLRAAFLGFLGRSGAESTRLTRPTAHESRSATLPAQL